MSRRYWYLITYDKHGTWISTRYAMPEEVLGDRQSNVHLHYLQFPCVLPVPWSEYMHGHDNARDRNLTPEMVQELSTRWRKWAGVQGSTLERMIYEHDHDQ